MICDKCNGNGDIYIQYVTIHDKVVDDKKICDKCKGTGEVNWIENIFGKQEWTRQSYHFQKTIYSDKWILNHNLNQQYVVVYIYDDNGKEIIPLDIEYIDRYTAMVTFSNEQIGSALVTKG